MDHYGIYSSTLAAVQDRPDGAGTELSKPGAAGKNGRYVADDQRRARGRVDGDRLTAVARWRGGATCEFAGTIRFGLGEPEPNWFICRDAGGQVLSEGPFDVQGIRLSGCLR
jgi:hypothetical protein